MKIMKMLLCLCALTSFILPSMDTQASVLGKAAARAAAKKAAAKHAAKSVATQTAKEAEAARLAAIYKKDLARDAKTVAKPLAKEQQVHRYTTAKQAQKEVKSGLQPGTHTTSALAQGRPLSGNHAKDRYGLEKSPTVRTVWRLPAGTKVKKNKVVGGEPGVGELNVSETVSPSNYLGKVPLDAGVAAR